MKRMMTGYILYVVFILLLVSFIGCQDTIVHREGSNNQGGDGLALHLPFPIGKGYACTQGAKGDYSHMSSSTKYDIDLNTSNVVQEELYAPVSGVAHVHDGAPQAGFGIHVNIALSDDRYVVLAHLDRVFVSDGDEVTRGQLIGFEGCSGVCTGDHVHIGVHAGDPAQSAGYGTSEAVDYIVRDQSNDTRHDAFSSESFVCGVKASGDDQDGDVYASELRVSHWHPNGTLVKTMHRPDVFLLENNALRWFEYETVFWDHGYRFDDVVFISDEEFGCYEQVANMPAVPNRMIVEEPSGQRWMLFGEKHDSSGYRMPLSDTAQEAVLTSWGFSLDEVNMLDPSAASQLLAWQPREQTLPFRDGTLVREETRSTVYLITEGVAVPFEHWRVYLLLGYGSRTPLRVPDGVIRDVQGVVGSCLGPICLRSESVYSCAGENTFSDLVREYREVIEEQRQKGVSLSASIRSDPEPSEVRDAGGSPQDARAFVLSDPDAMSDTGSMRDAGPIPDANPDLTDVFSGELPPDATDSSSGDVPQQESVDVMEADYGKESPTVGPCNGQTACIVDRNADGKDESLLMAADQWMLPVLFGNDAFVYGNGGCYDANLTVFDRVSASDDGYYALDFTWFKTPCASQLSLVSMPALASASLPPENQSLWYWWQNHPFCTQGYSLCELIDNGTDWEEWLLFVVWDPETGLVPVGNGYTNNAQLP